MLKGVKSVEPGYTGGKTQSPAYEGVCVGGTGHVEVTKIEYNPDELSFEELLQVFFNAHDATQVGGQGSDIGQQYRTAIFYTTDRQREKAQHYIDVLNKSATKRVVTTVEPLTTFWPAEDYHKKYFEAHKDAPYCQLVIAPKVEKIQKKFASILK